MIRRLIALALAPNLKCPCGGRIGDDGKCGTCGKQYR
jgi:DNA-directed RNA polymerase subunit RPC12/RpoP